MNRFVGLPGGDMDGRTSGRDRLDPFVFQAPGGRVSRQLELGVADCLLGLPIERRGHCFLEDNADSSSIPRWERRGLTQPDLLCVRFASMTPTWMLTMILIAADTPFHGRWNIQVENEPRNRVWWLEVSETPRFVGAPGGDLDKIGDVSIQGGQLTFSFVRGGRTLHYSARIEGDKLVGVRTGDGSTFRFTGKRAPAIGDKDDGTWWPGKPVPLFNGKDLSGWRPLVTGKPLGWQVKDGVLSNTAGANNLVSEQKFWNFVLHAEYRIVEGSNSGIGLRGRYEIQILDDYGKPPDSHGHGALYSRITPSENASRQPGEWQSLDVRLVGRQLRVILNGRKIIDRGETEGLTAMAHDADEASPGPIVLQGDHKEVEFRGLVVTPLFKK